MTRARAVLLALVGLALPAGLALGVYVASAGSLAAVPAVVEAPPKIARAAPTDDQATGTAPPTTTATSGDDDRRNEDLPGKCRKPENQLDPDCDPRSVEEDDSSGHGSGGDDDREDDSSGSGSGSDDDSSGPGSGDDD